MTASKPLGLGLVGCGGFGRFALAAVAELPGIDVQAVTDVDPDRAAAAAAAFGASVIPGREACSLSPRWTW